MRILWVLSVDPTRSRDGQLTYSLALIRAVAASGVDVTVVHLGTKSPDDADGLPISWRAAGTANRNRLLSLLSRLPAMAYTAGSPEFRRLLVKELGHRWDAVVIDHVQSGWAMKPLLESVGQSTVVVHVSHNDEKTVRRNVALGTSTNLVSRLVLELDARKVAALEERMLKRSDLVTTITDEDATAFRVRRSGLNTEILSPGYDGARVGAREITAAVPRRAVIAGSMLWRVKQFDLLAFLRVADQRFADAGAEIVVIGEAPPEFAAEVLRTTTATKMAGRVDSFVEQFAQARLALVSEPHGGGFKLKTLDYAFHRVPMLVQAGSVTGLPLANADGLFEFASIEALVDGALGVLDDFVTLNRLQNVAYDKCDTAFAWSQRGARFRDAISNVRKPGE